MYYGAINYENLWEWLRKVPCKYALSFDGISGDVNNTYEVPKDIYTSHLYVESVNSSFKKVIGKSNDCIVKESMYVSNEIEYV